MPVNKAQERFNRFIDVNIRLQNTSSLAYQINKRIDRVRYMRSQTNKRVLGKAGGIKFEGDKKVRVTLPSMTFHDLDGNPHHKTNYEDDANHQAFVDQTHIDF